MMVRLADLFPAGDFEHQMGFRRGGVAAFFLPRDPSVLLAERREWLGSAAGNYAVLASEGEPLLAETLELAAELETIAQDSISPGASPLEQCVALGKAWEPDFLLLGEDDAGSFRLWGGAVCFPSSWSLPEKIGMRVEEIHGVVPGLNPQLGGRIRTFLSRLRPDAAWMRTNWGLSGSPEFNQHPSRALPALGENPDPDAVWLRVEHQVLARLPKTGGILFGIRIAIHSLNDVKGDLEAAERLAVALETMPEEVARYKRISLPRRALIGFMRS